MVSLDESDDSEPMGESFEGEREKWHETYWRGQINKQCQKFEDAVRDSLLRHMREGEQRMTKALNTLTAKDEAMARKLSHEIPSAKELAERLIRSATDYCRNNYGALRETIVIPDSDTDEADSEGVQRVDTSAGNGLPGRRREPDEPTHDSDSDEPVISRPKRARRRYHSPTSAFQGECSSTGMRMIQYYEVEEKDFIFPYPAIGPGYFILRCDRGGGMHCFDRDPLLKEGRPKDCNLGLKHFASRAAAHDCHDRDTARLYPEEEMVRTFGYKVVNIDGTNVDSDWVEASNYNLTEKPQNVKPKRKAKGKQKATAPPPVVPPAAAPPPAVPPPRAAHLPPLGYDAAHRPPRPSLPTSTPAHGGARPPAPEPDMGFNMGLDLGLNMGLNMPAANQGRGERDAPPNHQAEDADTIMINGFVQEALRPEFISNLVRQQAVGGE